MHEDIRTNQQAISQESGVLGHDRGWIWVAALLTSSSPDLSSSVSSVLDVGHQFGSFIM